MAHEEEEQEGNTLAGEARFLWACGACRTGGALNVDVIVVREGSKRARAQLPAGHLRGQFVAGSARAHHAQRCRGVWSRCGGRAQQHAWAFSFLARRKVSRACLSCMSAFLFVLHFSIPGLLVGLGVQESCSYPADDKNKRPRCVEHTTHESRRETPPLQS